MAPISGGTTGSGPARAQRFARTRACVLAAGRDETAGLAAVAPPNDAAGEIRHDQADVAQVADCARLVAATLAADGAPHSVVASAAVGTRCSG